MRRVVIVMLVIISSCSKYEEGPDFSLKSKTSRISNHWIMGSYLVNGADYTLSFNTTHLMYQLSIGVDNKYSLFYKPNAIDHYSETGTWKFSGDKTHLILTRSDSKETDYQIIRLEEKDLRLRYTNEEGHDIECHLTPKPHQ